MNKVKIDGFFSNRIENSLSLFEQAFRVSR